MSSKKFLVALAAPYLLVGAVAFGLARGDIATAGAASAPTAVAPSTTQSAPAPAPAPVTATTMKHGFADVIARVQPSIVSVFAARRAEASGFRFGLGGTLDPQDLPLQRGIGSGIVMTSDGTIVTNRHVVDGASSVRVKLADGRELDARVLGTDAHTDIAVIKVQARDLPTVEFADSDRVAVGEYALAIGSPFGLASSASLGIVSGTGRGNLGIIDYEDFIQTDAAINPGNSGGALIDAQGRVIGVSTAIVSNGGRGNLGIGLAVPANLARAVVAQLVAHGKVTRGWLGVGIQDVTPELAAALGRGATAGALIGDVAADAPAARAGLRAGDVVVELDGKPVADARTLRLRIAQMAPGTDARLVVERDGKRLPVTVKLGTLAEPRAAGGDAGSERGRDGARGTRQVADLDLGELTPEIARQLGLPRNTTGVVILAVRPNSRAAEAGLARGDVIEEIDGAPVRDPDAAERALRAAGRAGDKPRLLRVRRGDVARFVALAP